MRKAKSKFNTECPNGHPFTPENTYTNKRGNGGVSRECRICHKLRQAIRNKKQSEARAVVINKETGKLELGKVKQP